MNYYRKPADNMNEALAATVSLVISVLTGSNGIGIEKSLQQI